MHDRIGWEHGRRIVLHDSDASPTRTLIVFDGEVWRANAVGWLTRRYPGLRVVSIDGEGVGPRRELLPDPLRVEELIAAVCAEAVQGPVALAGQSFGGSPPSRLGFEAPSPSSVS